MVEHQGLLMSTLISGAIGAAALWIYVYLTNPSGTGWTGSPFNVIGYNIILSGFIIGASVQLVARATGYS